MRKLLTLFLLLGVISFSYAESGDKNARTNNTNKIDVVKDAITPASTSAVLFEDNFNGSNTVAALQSRGWVVLDVDGGGTTAAFYQGSASVFPAFEGPDTGYVASNYNGANGMYINHWLISPSITVHAGDTLTFKHRSPDNNPYDDSIYVRWSPTAGITPADFTQTWGRYLVSETGWATWTGTFPANGTVRFAIQYYHTDGGPTGNYSNYMGIDKLQVLSPVQVPVELISFAASVNDGNVTLTWSTATETNNKGFDIQRRVGDGEFVTVGHIAGKGTTTEKQNYSFTDKNLEVGVYTYRLKQVDLDGKYSYSNMIDAEIVRPAVFALDQNYPNPFNPATKITFSLAVDSKVTLSVYNVLGQQVATLVNGTLTAGSHSAQFDASALQSGVYFAKIDAKGIDGSNFSSVKKMILSK